MQYIIGTEDTPASVAGAASILGAGVFVGGHRTMRVLVACDQPHTLEALAIGNGRSQVAPVDLSEYGTLGVLSADRPATSGRDGQWEQFDVAGLGWFNVRVTNGDGAELAAVSAAVEPGW